MLFRFIAALGIGGEWAVGASLLSETWPKKWRAWIAAVLQTGVNVGILMAVGANLLLAPIVSQQPRYLFLVGVLPALSFSGFAAPFPSRRNGIRPNGRPAA